VLTGSTNFTRTDTGTNDTTGPALSRGNNLNHILILKGDSAAGQYLPDFQRLREPSSDKVDHYFERLDF